MTSFQGFHTHLLLMKILLLLLQVPFAVLSCMACSCPHITRVEPQAVQIRWGPGFRLALAQVQAHSLGFNHRHSHYSFGGAAGQAAASFQS
jgi:hypothetical protein